MTETKWKTLKDIFGDSAEPIPQLLSRMCANEPEKSRMEAGEDFWRRISCDGPMPFATATAPAISQYLRMAANGKLITDGTLIGNISIILDECEPSSDDSSSLASLKSEIRAVIESREPWFWKVFEEHSDSRARVAAAGMLSVFGRARGKLVTVLTRQFQLTSVPNERADVVAEIYRLLDEMEDGESWLLNVARGDVGLPQFLAAAYAACRLRLSTPPDVIDVLSAFGYLCEEEGIFETYNLLLLDACTAIPKSAGIEVLEKVLFGMKDPLYANRVCWGLLCANFETAIGPVVIGVRSAHDGGGRVFDWDVVVTKHEGLDPAARKQLCKILSSCERLWHDEFGGSVSTNLFKLFGLPSDRGALQGLAERSSTRVGRLKRSKNEL